MARVDRAGGASARHLLQAWPRSLSPPVGCRPRFPRAGGAGGTRRRVALEVALPAEQPDLTVLVLPTRRGNPGVGNVGPHLALQKRPHILAKRYLLPCRAAPRRARGPPSRSRQLASSLRSHKAQRIALRMGAATLNSASPAAWENSAPKITPSRKSLCGRLPNLPPIARCCLRPPFSSLTLAAPLLHATPRLARASWCPSRAMRPGPARTSSLSLRWTLFWPKPKCLVR